jgi:hypothetical protein
MHSPRPVGQMDGQTGQTGKLPVQFAFTGDSQIDYPPPPTNESLIFLDRMTDMRLSLLWASVLGALAWAGPQGLCRGDDFRIESKVYVADEKTPVSQNTTLFRTGIVYDYLADPPRVAVFDKPHHRFVLLDALRKQKTDINAEQVLTFCAELRSLAVSGPNSFLKFCGDPKFSPELDEKSGDLIMSSEFITYKLQTMRAKTPEIGHQVREFSDWYHRLNAMTNRGSIPPFARLAVNEELDKQGLIASQVYLSIPPQNILGGKPVFMRSEHAVTWGLLPRDLKKISETGNDLVNFKAVTFAEFMQPQVATKK